MQSVAFCFRNSWSRACGKPMAHEKTIAQSRDRQGADPLADARGSVRNFIFEAAALLGKPCGRDARGPREKLCSSR